MSNPIQYAEYVDDDPVPPYIVAHRDVDPGPPPRWGRWYLEGIYASGELDSDMLESEQHAVYDSRGRRLDVYRMPDVLRVMEREGDEVDLELLLRRHLAESNGAGAEDPSLTLDDLIIEIGPANDPGRIARAVFVISFVTLVLAPWVAGVALAIWAIQQA